MASDGLPDLLQVPTGSGKTEAAVLPWLYRRLAHPDQAVRVETPRRLVFALPMRVLVSQTEERIRGFLRALGLEDEVPLHVLMGGSLDSTSQHAWRREMHRPSIVIGTVDCVVSRALIRGYGASRGSYPVDFALVTNGAHLVLDEIQLCAQSGATLRQVEGFAAHFGTLEPLRLTCMSATVDRRVLDVVDNPWSEDEASIQGLGNDDLAQSSAGSLGFRLAATRRVVHEKGVTDPRSLAARVLATHEPDSLTLVVVNTVRSAVETFRELRKARPEAELLLAHSRFRGRERTEIGVRITRALPREGRVVVATQVVEAGIDIDSRHLFTERAPWPSVIQRAGRCNRAGEDPSAQLHWFDTLTPINKQPYAEGDLLAATTALETLSGTDVTSRDLQNQAVDPGDLALRVIRRGDLESLFDTSADLAGRDVDVAPYIRESEPLDVQVAWIDAEQLPAQGRSRELPVDGWRCPVPPAELTVLLQRSGVRAWSYDQHGDRWAPLAPTARVRPNDLVLVDRDSGGYDLEMGFDPRSTGAVPIHDDDEARTDAAPAPEDEGLGADAGSVSQPAWVTLDQHSRDTRGQVEALLAALEVPLPRDLAAATVAAAYLHDVGKAHPDWQQALAHTGDQPPEDERYAKSPGGGRLRVLTPEGRERRGFRHELVSALMLGAEAGEVVLERLGVRPEHRDLCRYLVAAHHGKVRLQPRDAISEGHDGLTLLGLVDGEPLPGLVLDGEHELGGGWVDLDVFGAGDDTWARLSGGLLETLGPFRLAYLETVVRMSDWRASGSFPLAVSNPPVLQEDECERHSRASGPTA